MKRREENSGLIDLDALLHDSGPDVNKAVAPAPAPARASAPAPAPARASAPAPAPASAPALAPVLHAADSLEAVSAIPPSASVVAPPPSTAAPARSSRRRNGIAAGVVGAMLAALVVVRIAHAPGAHPIATASVNAIAATPPPVAPLAVAPPEVQNLDPSALPSAAENVPAPAAPPVAAVVAHGARAIAPVAAPAPTAHVTEADLAAVAGKDPGDLGGAMRSAVGPRAEAKTAESTAGGNARQMRPSPGAVIGAINSVLPAARACLGPDAAIRTGSLVFRSDGSVASVDLNGAKSEDGCVKTALSKARVEAFADDTFATRVTVRP